jgi:hypothetical protein
MTVTTALPSTARPGDTLAAGPGGTLAAGAGGTLAAGQAVQNLGVMTGPLEPWGLS